MIQPSLDVTACDAEPIHAPDAIQPHGVLVAMDGPDDVVSHISLNALQLLGIAPDHVLHHPLTQLLGTSAADVVLRASRERDPEAANPLRLALHGHVFDGVVHRSDAATILEIEPEATLALPVDRVLRSVLRRVQRARSVDDLCSIAAEQVRALTGFDRVMVYRFDEDGHGQVIAEDRAPDAEAFLGHHFPASDIPQQARTLYLANPVRAIPDARAAAVPLLHAPGHGPPLDLTFASLRAVSPVHLEYLANMGVRASLSVSLVRGDRLWGLVACHHRCSAREVPFAVRSACETVARAVSAQLEALEEIDRRTRRDALRGAESILVDAMQSSREGWAGGLLERPESLLSLVRATGVAIRDEHGIRTTGDVPSPPSLSSILSKLSSLGTDVFATSALPSELPSAEGLREVASGLLAVRIPGAPPGFILWFRREVPRTRIWGGDPSKPVDLERGRLHPRRSFRTWTELVRGTSAPWAPAEVDAAEDLGRRVIEVDLQRQITRAAEAIRARDDLVAVVSHDLKSPLSVVGLAVRTLRRAVGDSPQLVVQLDRIHRAQRQMTALITGLLDLAALEAGRFRVQPAPCTTEAVLGDALSVCGAAAEQRGVRLDCTRVENLQLMADRDRLVQVLQNLISNAIKFAPEGSTIELSAAREGAFVRFEVRDEGPGIAPEELPHLFERYWRSPDVRRTVGSGLGLFIAKGLVEAHGGRIWATSVVGEGSAFCFTLPAGVGPPAGA